MSADGGLPFSRRASAWVLGLAVPSFALFLVALALGRDGAPVPSRGASSYSRSALGHHAFVQVLDALGLPVLRGRHRAAELAGRDGVLLLLEPLPDVEDVRFDGRGLAAAVAEAPRALLALPKRHPTVHHEEPGWAGPPRLRTLEEVDAVLDALDVEGVEVLRTDAVSGWSTQGIAPDPDLPGPVQLLRGPGIDPWIACDEGTLVGEVLAGGRAVLVVADPDVLATAGLGRGGNAALAVRLVEHLRRGGPIVVDEVLHGHALAPNLWRRLLELPLLVLTLQAALLACLALAGGLARRRPAIRPEPTSRGTAALLDQAVDLQVHHGDAWTTADRYARDALDAVRRRLHAPRTLEPGTLASWIGRIEAARGLGGTWAGIEADRRARAGPAVDLAQRIHRWREGVLDGTR